MTRLIIVVEGQTEEAFVKDVLQPHLATHGVYASATIVGKMVAQRRGHRQRGGGHFRHWRQDLARILGGDHSGGLRVTMLFDLYGLPSDFPGFDAHGADTNTTVRCELLESALGVVFDDPRLIPYIQRHEFEALVLASLTSLRELLDAEDDLAGLEVLEQQVGSQDPEDVNDGKDTAPSKRLEILIPSYSKVLYGALATSDTGLLNLRKRCSRFGAWLEHLERL